MAKWLFNPAGNALYDPNALYGDTGTIELGVIGFAADGFPIFGPYIRDDGGVRKAVSSARLLMAIVR